MKRCGVLAAVVLIVSGCLPGPGQGIVDRIRAANSPIVREVVLSPANPFGGKGEEVHVYIADTATEAEAVELWCDVVILAGIGQLPVGAVNIWRGGENGSGVWNPLRHPICPDRSPAP
jgi:hypothetical protein